MKSTIVFIALSLFMVTTVNAEQCTKNFKYHFIIADGTLGFYQGVGGAWWYPCSVSIYKNGVTPQACKAALETYLSAKEQKKPITLRYSGTCYRLNSATTTQVGFDWFGVYW